MPLPLFHRLFVYFVLGGFVMWAVPLVPLSFATLPLAVLIGLVVVAVTGPFERWLIDDESRLLTDVATRLRNPFFRLPIPGGLALDHVLRETTELAETFGNELIPADGETIRREAQFRLGERGGYRADAARQYALFQLAAGAVVAGFLVLAGRIAVTHEWYPMTFLIGAFGLVSWCRWIEFDATPKRLVLTNGIAAILLVFVAYMNQGDALEGGVLELGILAAVPILFRQTYAAWWSSRRAVYRHAASTVDRTSPPEPEPEPEPEPAPEPERRPDAKPEPAPVRDNPTDGWILKKGTGKYHLRMCQTVQRDRRAYKRVARADVPRAGVCLRCQALD